MEKYNYNKLKGRIKEKCETQIAFAEKIGITPNSVSRKLNNIHEWSQSEICKSMEILDLSISDIGEYFFCRVS